MRTALVHERFTEPGGSELVVERLAGLVDNPVLCTPLLDRRVLPPGLRDVPTHVSPLNRLYRQDGRYAHFLPTIPAAMRWLLPEDVDLVVTSHHAFANRVQAPAGVPILSYVHSPARWIWDPRMRAGEAGGWVGQQGLRAFAASQRRADRAAARRVTRLLANSSAVQARIKRWWGLDSHVLHPPVDVTRHHPDPAATRGDCCRLAGRLGPYKRPDLAVRAAVRAGVPLVVAGDGRARAELESIAGPTVEFLGRVDDDTLRDLFRRARAVLMPGEEDFGIVPVEAQACGTPVIALAAGGALDTVIPGRSGVHVPAVGPEDEVAAWAGALRDFDGAAFDAAALRRHAKGFSAASFDAKASAHLAAMTARVG